MGKRQDKGDVVGDGRPDDSNLSKTLQEFAAQKRKKNTSLYLDQDVYAEAKRIFGAKKVGAVVEAALKDIIEEWKRQNGLSDNKKPED